MADGDRDTKRAQEQSPLELKVTDRRHFTSSGERRADSESFEEPVEQASGDASTTEQASPGNARQFERRSLDDPEGVNFTMLINAMAQPALLFLGEVPHPGTGKPETDLEQARLQIDMLDLLRVKSRGNLTPQEEELLERVLYQLRMLYVSRSSGTE